jgi:hypothetical protein
MSSVVKEPLRVFVSGTAIFMFQKTLRLPVAVTLHVLSLFPNAVLVQDRLL